MIHDDERTEAENIRRTFGERLSERLSESLGRFSERWDDVRERFSKLKKLFVRADKKTAETAEEMLENYLGRSVYKEKLMFIDIVRWLKGKREGFDTIVFKIDDAKLNELLGSGEENITLGDEKYIAAVIMDNEKIKESLLVHYKTLDDKLEEALSNGDYVL